MAVGREINQLVNAYCRLRDRQHAVYGNCAKRHNLTTNELFAPEGCTQTEIYERLSANKQTIAAIAAIAGRFLKKGYIFSEEVAEDRRNKRICLTPAGRAYAKEIIPPAAEAENLAMAELGKEKLCELVRLTEKLTESMERRFSLIGEE